MRLPEIALMTLGGVWQGIRQDWNLFEIALIGAGVWAWKKGWRPSFAAPRAVRRPWLWALALAGGQALAWPAGSCRPGAAEVSGVKAGRRPSPAGDAQQP